MPSFFRFRSTNALLSEFHELERQEIYFAPPDQLNDPIEGFKDLFWQGDEIVWCNLLRHYLMCLMWGFTVVKIGGNYRETLSQETPLLSRVLLPVPQGREIHRQICERFFGQYGIDEVPALLAKCNVRFRRDAVEFVLRALHQVAFDSVLNVYRANGIEKSPAPDRRPHQEVSPKDVVASMKNALTRIAAGDDSIIPEQLSIAFSVGGHLAKQMELINYVRDPSEHARAWLPLFSSFSETYIDRLQHFIYFKWYAACFAADPNDAAMWGNYADSHRGCCLQFRSANDTNGKPTIKLHGIIGSSGIGERSEPLFGDIPLTFEPMTYVDKPTPIDFFQSLARAPIPDLKRDWYVDENGNRSECGLGAITASRDWSEKNWAAFRASTTRKMLDWKHEAEHRLVMPSTFDLYVEPAARKLRYQFDDLEGVIFGIKTPIERKEEIINIILAKCEKTGRKDFEFSQALYASYSGKMETRKMDALRIA